MLSVIQRRKDEIDSGTKVYHEEHPRNAPQHIDVWKAECASDSSAFSCVHPDYFERGGYTCQFAKRLLF